MSQCCGASMIGSMGTLRHNKTFIHQVPIVYCPVCQHMKVHPRVKEEYEILSEYAHSDHAPEVYFNDYVEEKKLESIFEDCFDVQGSSMEELLRSQIDHALDLVSVAKKLQDSKWEKELFQRLKVLSTRLNKRMHKKKLHK